jgi:predicted transcriptional regulator
MCLLVLCSAVPDKLQNSAGPDESTVKALFVYNFTKQIEWPAHVMNTQKFVITVLGDSPVKDRLNIVLKGRRIFDKPVEIRGAMSIDDIQTTQILYVSKSHSAKLQKILEQMDDKGILIVTEDKGMAAKGSCINIIQKDETLKFELNDVSIKKQGLKVSNQLYKLAVTIR